jgi:hypothetical protein
VRGIGTRQPVGYCSCRAEQSNRQTHPSRVRRLSHFQRSCDPRDQGEHTLSTKRVHTMHTRAPRGQISCSWRRQPGIPNCSPCLRTAPPVKRPAAALALYADIKRCPLTKPVVTAVELQATTAPHCSRGVQPGGIYAHVVHREPTPGGPESGLRRDRKRFLCQLPLCSISLRTSDALWHSRFPPEPVGL